MTDLISRLREAKEGSRELDAAIGRALTGTSASEDHWYDLHGKWTTDETVPAFTADLSAAVALKERVLPKWEWGIDAGWHGDEPSIVAYVGKAVPDGVIGHDWQAQGPNPALALCIAILRAKAVAHD